MNRPLARLAALVALALLGGCGGGSRPVVLVGKGAVTVDDYYWAAPGASEQYPVAPDSAKALFLEDLIRHKLLMLEADNRGMFEDSLVINFRRLKEEELLVQSLGQELAPAGIPVSEAEIRALYTQRDSSAHVQLIYAFNEVTASAAAGQARAGGDFGAIADQFNPPGMLPPHGDIGSQVPGDLVAPLDELVHSAPPGTIAGPLESPAQGWFVMKVLSREKHPQNAYEMERARLGDMLRQRKQRETAIERYRRLRQGYALRLEPGAGQILFAHFNTPPAGGSAGYTREDLARVLARWEAQDGPHVYTFAEALADLDIGGRDKPNALVLPAIEQWILLQTTRRVQVAEARRRGMPLDPKWKRQLDVAVNNYVLEALYNNAIGSQPTSGPNDALEAYQRNQARFEHIAEAHLQLLEFPDSAAAYTFTQHAGHLMHGHDLRGVAASVPGAPAVTEMDVHYPTLDPTWSQMEPTLRSMNHGDAIGPFPAQGRWAIAMLDTKRSEVTPFESLDANVRNMLQQEGTELARERVFLAFLSELKRRYPVVPKLDVIRKLPWPVPRAS